MSIFKPVSSFNAMLFACLGCLIFVGLSESWLVAMRYAIYNITSGGATVVGGTLRNDGDSGVKGSSAGTPHVQTEGLGNKTDSRHIWTEPDVKLKDEK